MEGSVKFGKNRIIFLYKDKEMASVEHSFKGYVSIIGGFLRKYRVPVLKDMDTMYAYGDNFVLYALLFLKATRSLVCEIFLCNYKS